MSKADPKVDAYYESLEQWHDEMAALRAILHETALSETFKWRGPCYTYGGNNVSFTGALKDYFALSFFKGVLLRDPEGILVPPGRNSRIARLFRFTHMDEVRKLKPVIKAYVAEAIELEKAGRKVELPDDDIVFPEELVAKMAEDADFAAAFEALTPGRQRGYAIHFSGAKQAATRMARIEKHAPRILKGKGMHDR